jgi:hypothetical protein
MHPRTKKLNVVNMKESAHVTSQVNDNEQNVEREAIEQWSIQSPNRYDVTYEANAKVYHVCNWRQYKPRKIMLINILRFCKTMWDLQYLLQHF